MIRNNTVFVLGAGESCHYGYPTGEGLVDQVVKMTERLSQYCENHIFRPSDTVFAGTCGAPN